MSLPLFHLPFCSWYNVIVTHGHVIVKNNYMTFSLFSVIYKNEMPFLLNIYKNRASVKRAVGLLCGRFVNRPYVIKKLS